MTTDDWSWCFATLNHSALFDTGVDVVTQIDAAAAAGFALVELDVFSLRAWRERHGSLDGVTAALERHGIPCLAIAGLNVLPDPDATAADIDDLAAHCAALRPRWLLTRVVGAVDDAHDALRRAAAAVEPLGTRLAFEPSPFTEVRTVADAVALLDATGVDGAVIVDSWHFFATGADWALLARTDPARIAYLQLADALDPGDDPTFDTMHRRAQPGAGRLDLGRFLAEAHRLGLPRVVSLEVLSATGRTESVEGFARAAIEGARAAAVPSAR